MSITIPCPCGGTMRETEFDADGCDVIECPECLARIRVRAVQRITGRGKIHSGGSESDG